MFHNLFANFLPASRCSSLNWMSCRPLFCHIRPNRVASAPYFSTSSSGSMPVPSDLDMRLPSLARTDGLLYTAVKGAVPVNASPDKIIRLTQRLMLSLQLD